MKKLNKDIVVISEKESIEKYYSPKSAGQVFLYATSLNLLIIFCYYSILQICKIDVNNLNFLLTSLSLCLGSLSFLFAIMINQSRSKIKISKIFNVGQKTPYYVYIIVAVMAIALVLLSSNFISIVDALIKSMGFSSLNTNYEITNWWKLIIAIVVIGVLPAIFEELVFRGVILSSVKKRGIVLAVFVSAISFTLMHGNIYQTVFQFMLGLTLAFVVAITSDVKTGMLMHFLNNLVIILNSYIMFKLGKSQVAPVLTPTYIILAIVMLLVGIGLMVGGMFLLKFIMKKKNLGYYAEIKAAAVEISNTADISNTTDASKVEAIEIIGAKDSAVLAANEPLKTVAESDNKPVKTKKPRMGAVAFLEEYSYLSFTLLVVLGLWVFNTISLLG